VTVDGSTGSAARQQSGGFLARACAESRARVAEARRLVSLQQLRTVPAPHVPSLHAALHAPGVAVIAEVKRASPSKGHLAWVPDPAAHAGAYEAGGAAAVSVLTEPAHFRGTLADLTVVAQAVALPVIRKDFVVDPYQVWEARRAGAAAVLLIVAALPDELLVRLLEEVGAAGLDALVEVHDAEEAARAGAAQRAARGAPPPIVGVNARDLTTLQVDPRRFGDCVDALPPGAIAVAESGVDGPEDVCRAGAAGADAVLVGEHVVTSDDPEAAVRRLVAAGRSLTERLPSPADREETPT
jgi:indole-3-glycerol phosphate synthase